MSALLNRRRTYGIRAPYTQAQIDAEHRRDLSQIRAGRSVPYKQTATHAMYEANIALYTRNAKVALRFTAAAMVVVLAGDVLGGLLGWWSL